MKTVVNIKELKSSVLLKKEFPLKIKFKQKIKLWEF